MYPVNFIGSVFRDSSLGLLKPENPGGGRGVTVSLASPIYVFDRNMFEGTPFSSRSSNRANLGGGPFALVEPRCAVLESDGHYLCRLVARSCLDNPLCPIGQFNPVNAGDLSTSRPN